MTTCELKWSILSSFINCNFYLQTINVNMIHKTFRRCQFLGKSVSMWICTYYSRPQAIDND